MGPHKSRVERDNHLPVPAGHPSPDGAQDPICLLSCQSALLAHIQSLVHQDPQVLLCRAALKDRSSQPVQVPGVLPAQMQNLALCRVEPHQVHPSPALQPVEVPLNGIPSFHRINRTTQLGVVSKLAEGALNSLIDVINKDVKEHRSQDRPLGDTTCYRPPPGHRAIDHHPLSAAFQPIAYPSGRPPIKSTSLQFGDEDVVGDHVKGLAQVQVNDIGRLPFVHQCRHSIIEGHKIS
ncbi:uncharacterized protein LOC125688256 [Lagopus muta]|uniref:uncharacterized protein LOC125688256 n=1 Tax=Lagopus muta TaxID=64668 RepID=UPI00209CFDD0|nr:uncharacterized protein LOC125688256 [Lagopus muta]XP_048790015.1 uncharacterized protein LOC125688256 [Lagopus muta]